MLHLLTKRVARRPVQPTTSPLPLDLFRLPLGIIAFFYFRRTMHEVDDFSAPDGMLDHDIIEDTYWYTRLHFFPAQMQARHYTSVYQLAQIGSLLLAAGVWPRRMSTLLFATASATFRRNFPVSYLDDTIMQLMLFWLMLLPTGETLSPSALRQAPRAVDRRIVDYFRINLALIYLVAGLWKWSSPMWRQGFALYAGLNLNVAHSPQRWRRRNWFVIRVASYVALVSEPLLALIVRLPPHSRLKKLLALQLIALHAGILATLKIPFANLALLATLPVHFADELGGPLPDAEVRRAPRAALFVGRTVPALIALTHLWEAIWRPAELPDVGTRKIVPLIVYNPFRCVLWLLGLVQSYRLFDWIERVSHATDFELCLTDCDGRQQTLDYRQLLPQSMRHVLLQSYLLNIHWIRAPYQRSRWRAAIYVRYVRRFCRVPRADGRYDLFVTRQAITPDNLLLRRPTRYRLLSFYCCMGQPRITYLRLED